MDYTTWIIETVNQINPFTAMMSLENDQEKYQI